MMRHWGFVTAKLTGCLPTEVAAREGEMAGKINRYDHVPEYSDDDDIGNVNVDKYEIRNAADAMSDYSEGNSPLAYKYRQQSRNVVKKTSACHPLIGSAVYAWIRILYYMHY